MANFTQFIPSSGQHNVSRTTLIGFTIDDDVNGVQINTLYINVNGIKIIENGLFINGYSGKISHGVNKYVVGIYPKMPFYPRASQVDVIIQVYDNLSLVSKNYSFYIIGYGEAPIVEPTVVENRSCDSSVPFFPPTDLGLVFAKDDGIGTEVHLEWKEAYPSDESNIVFYNLYISTDRSQVFDGYPKFFVTDNLVTIGGLRPGDQYFFGVRATEFNSNYLTLAGRTQVGLDLYKYVYSTIETSISDTSLFIPASTVGFPNFGIILIGDELIRYTSKQISPNGFIVASNGRGFYRTIAETHSTDLIRIYIGKEDKNTKIVQSEPTFQKPNYALTNILKDGYGNDGYRDGYDGYAFFDGYLKYKEKEYDDITTSGTGNDILGGFNRLDYCGTWRPLSPANFMKGQCRATYFGGAQVRFDADGNRHLVKETNVETHLLQREELLLETTGEPFVLLRRMWTGIRCHCFMNRREHPDARCPVCFGGGYVQNYVQFFNFRRADRRILIRIDPSNDDTNILDRGLEPMYEPSGWLMAFPQVKDRDVLIRFNLDNTEEYRYEILDVNRVRTFFTQSGAQKIKIKRFPKTDIIYSFPVLRDASPRPEAMNTSVSSTPGINSHSHQIVVPDGADLSRYRGATLVSEGHNHIIISGLVQNVLNHTHTI